jgi:hypothetical protein
MGKGKNKWVVSEWVDLDSDETWLTIIAVAGWILLMIVAFGE